MMMVCVYIYDIMDNVSKVVMIGVWAQGPAITIIYTNI